MPSRYLPISNSVSKQPSATMGPGRLRRERRMETKTQEILAMALQLPRGEQALTRFVSAIEHAIQLVQGFPEAWPKTERGDARQITVLGTPYLLIYRLEPPEIVILAVAHGRQRPGYWRNRVPE